MRRRRLGCVARTLLLLVVIALAIGLMYAFDALVVAPWAYGIFGRPTLTGSWTGALRAQGGVRYAFYLQLSRSQSFGDLPIDHQGVPITGDLSWCAPGDHRTTSPVEGHVVGSTSNVNMWTDERNHPRSGLYLNYFHAAWHGSTLVMHPEFELFRNNSVVESDATGALSLTLYKREFGAYQAACSSL